MIGTKKVSNVPAEQIVLAGLCQLGKDTYVDISQYVTTDSFTSDTYKVLFRCIESIFSEAQFVDYPYILSKAVKEGCLGLIEKSSEEIKDLFSLQISSESVLNAAKMLLKLHIVRQAQEQHRKAYNDLQKVTGDETIDKIISLSEKPIFDLSLSLNLELMNSPELIGKNLQDYMHHLKTQSGKQVGIESGYKLYDASIGGGIRRKTVAIIGARTGAGKSALADNFAINICSRNIPVLMLDTEMSYEDHVNRMLANMSNIDINMIETGAFTKKNILEQEVNKASERLSKFPYHYISVAGRSFEEILSIMRRWVIKEVGYEAGRSRDCLILYDYLKLMDSSKIDKTMQEYQALGFLMTQLHDFTVKYDVPLQAFVQLNRDGISDESTAVISQSDRIAWLCTALSIFKKKSDEEIAIDGPENGNRKLIFIKGRHAAEFSSGNYISYNMKGNICKITEMKSRDEIHKKA